MFAPGLGTLVPGPIELGGLYLQPVLDESLVSSNSGEWISTFKGAVPPTTYFYYSKK